MSQQFPTLPEHVSVSDHVFDAIQSQIQSLQLVPGTKLSETEVARQFGISRQPVRDAFYRLSKLGFLFIRPQRATEVSLISPQAILAARFLRTAAEVEMVRRAALVVTPDQIAHLNKLIDVQADLVASGDLEAFRHQDDAFHKAICAICDLEIVWSNLAENKAHTDRLRLLSIRDGSAEALEDHRLIVGRLEARDPLGAAAAMRGHLDRIKNVLGDLIKNQPEWFTQTDKS